MDTYTTSVLCTGITIIAILAVLMREHSAKEGGVSETVGVEKQRGSKGRGRLFKILAAFGILLLILTRAWRFGTIPGGVNQDEAMAAVDAYALSRYGTDRFGMDYPVHFTAWGYGQMSVLLSYLMVPFIKLFGFHILSVRLPMLLVSILGGVALFLLVREVAGRRAGLFVLYLTVISPWHFMQSRWSLDCNVFPHMFVIGLFFLMKGIKKKRFLYFSMLFFALCMYSYGVAFYMVPFFLLAACIAMNRMGLVTIRQSLLSVGIYFFFAWPIWLTMAINAFGLETLHFWKLTIPYFPGSIRSGDILFFTDHPLSQFLQNVHSLLWVVFRQESDSLWNALDDFGTIYWCTMPFVFVGLVRITGSIREEKAGERKIGYILFLFYWLCALGTGLMISNVNVNRINIVFYAQLILAALGMEKIVRMNRGVFPVLCAVYLSMSLSFAGQYSTVYAREIREYFFEDFLAAVRKAQEYDSGRYYIALAVQSDEAANCAEILTLYEQQIDALYFQGKTDSFMGNEIPYAERYCYRLPTEEEISDETDVVYVLRKAQWDRFDERDFEISTYGEFILVRRR